MLKSRGARFYVICKAQSNGIPIAGSVMKKYVYLDSTIPSHLFDERPENQAFSVITRKWWDDERLNYNLVTSEYTIVELYRGNYPKKDAIIESVKELPVLSSNETINHIAGIFIKEFVMPKGAAGDAFHLACASFHKIDYLLTWNCNHLANANKEQHVGIVNSRLGLFVPKIITRLQLFSER
jgi:predicted nucleic acid-binding protein